MKNSEVSNTNTIQRATDRNQLSFNLPTRTIYTSVVQTEFNQPLGYKIIKRGKKGYNGQKKFGQHSFTPNHFQVVPQNYATKVV